MRIIARAFAIAALFLGWLLPFVSTANENQGHHQSGIVGRVAVEQVGLPPLWKVSIVTDTFKPVTVVQTDENGNFVVNLKPGRYRLAPFLGGDGGAALFGPAAWVTVEKKNFTIVEMSLIFPPT